MGHKESARSKAYKAYRNGKLIKPQKCSICELSKRLEIHHEDYSKPLVVIWLCRKCHMIKDGRMDLIHIKKKQAPKKCFICKRFMKPLRKGRCHACNEYFRRHGKERPYKENGKIELSLITHNALCKRCERKANIVGYPIKGFCRSCYTYLWRNKKLDMPMKIKNRKRKK